MWVALILYVLGAILVFNLVNEEEPRELGVNLAIATLWPCIAPLVLIWSFLSRKTD